jgi:hypothetical protein
MITSRTSMDKTDKCDKHEIWDMCSDRSVSLDATIDRVRMYQTGISIILDSTELFEHISGWKIVFRHILEHAFISILKKESIQTCPNGRGKARMSAGDQTEADRKRHRSEIRKEHKRAFDSKSVGNL